MIADANAAFDADLQAEKYKLLGVEEIYQQVSGIIQSQRAEIEDHRDTKGELHDRLESIKDIPQSNPRLQTTLPLWEQIELRRLIEKHGDDYESMQRDTKLNRYQKTAKQLEKRIKIYHALQNL